MKDVNNIMNIGLITTTLWLLISCHVYAQQSSKQDLSFAFDNAIEKQDQDIRLGDFIFHPAITFSQYHDDNIYASDSAEENDNISALKAELSLTSDWKQHLLGLKLGADANRYASFESENTFDNWIDIKAKYDVNKDSSLALAAAYINDHEDRASPEEIFGLEPTEYSENRVVLSFDRNFQQHSVKLAATAVNIDYHDLKTATGIISNDTRDRADNSIGGRFNYSLSPKYYLFIQSSVETRDYEQPVDINLLNRDSDIQSHVLGLSFRPGPAFNGELFAGRLTQKFDDSQFSRLSEADFGARLNWQISILSKISFIADRSIEETTLNNASGLLYDQYLIRFNQALDKHWSYYMNASRATADYQLLPRKDDYADYALGLNYQVEKGLSFGIDYLNSQRDSSEPDEDYRRNNIFLRVTAQI